MLCAYYVRLAELSASGCNRLWKALCCNTRKEDLARCTYLMSSVEWNLDALCLQETLPNIIKKRRVGGRSPKVGVNHVHVVLLCFV
jgi:hypothetical protein